jgi:flagellar biosynthesis protein FlhF
MDGMRLKSYFAGTVEAAMALAREELGPDALLVHSKKTTPETRHAGHYEVVFALAEPEPPSAPAGNFGQVFAAERDSAIVRLSSELALLRNRVEGMSGALASPAAVKQNGKQCHSGDTAAELCALEVERELAIEVVQEAGEQGGTPRALRKAIASRISVDATLGAAGASRRVVALAGPPGAGKTTTLVKLATRYGLSARRSVHMISTDVFRIGAAEQLKLYSSILGISFQAIETPLALAQALEEQRRKDLILIDTPGWGRRDLPELEELAAYMANDPDIDVHLVLPASSRGCDMTKMVSRYAVFQPAKLIFTRLDETDRYGPLLNLSSRGGKPISFLSFGEQIPEDIEPATSERISELLAGSLKSEAPSGVFVEGAN